jgi:hypothetical protein
MPSHDLLQRLVKTAALDYEKGSGHDGGGSAHARSAIDQRGESPLQQGHDRLDRHVENTQIVWCPVHQREMAINHAAGQDGRRLFGRKVDDGHDTSRQQAFRITAIARVADPELVGEDFTHGSFRTIRSSILTFPAYEAIVVSATHGTTERIVVKPRKFTHPFRDLAYSNSLLRHHMFQSVRQKNEEYVLHERPMIRRVDEDRLKIVPVHRSHGPIPTD